MRNRDNEIKDGVFQFKPGIFTAYLDGRKIADFNSEGAAKAGIDVEKNRRKQQDQAVKKHNEKIFADWK